MFLKGVDKNLTNFNVHLTFFAIIDGWQFFLGAS